MKGKREFLILAVIIIAVTTYISYRPTDRTTYDLPELPEVARGDITKIEMVTGNASVAVQREGEKWFVGEEKYPADKEQIDRMLDTLSELTLTAMVSESESEQRYDLSPNKKVVVKAYKNDKVLRDISVGKTAGTFRHTFVKISGDKRVFHAKDNFRDRFEKKVEALRDKQVLEFKTDEITAFKITKKGRTTQFTKSKPTSEDAAKNEAPSVDKNTKSDQVPTEEKEMWRTSEDKVGDTAKIRTYLQNLSNLKCTQYLDKAQTLEKDPEFIVVLTGAETHTLSLFSAEKKGDDDNTTPWPATSSQNDYPFFLAEFKAKEININPADLMPGQKEKKEPSQIKENNQTNTSQ